MYHTTTFLVKSSNILLESHIHQFVHFYLEQEEGGEATAKKKKKKKKNKKKGPGIVGYLSFCSQQSNTLTQALQVVYII